MQRIILHWTAGTHTVSSLDREHYHFIIGGSGAAFPGKHPISANAGPLKAGAYAAHTLNCNTGSIGVAVAAMAGAVERPFSTGRYPILPVQVAALAKLCASLCRDYDIEVSRKTVLTHAEVQQTLGIAQRGKWDITWLPGMAAAGGPITVGDAIRALIVEELAPKPAAEPAPLSIEARVAALEAAVFGKQEA